ncbi:MAG: hypothetical protein AAFW84_09795 [Cyanobacteria bacterium J06635_15]
MPHPFLAEVRHKQPAILSIYWNGRQILRIESGEIVLEQTVRLEPGLLTIHFDDEPMPMYALSLTP